MDKSEFIKQFKSRTKALAVKIVLFYDEMPKTDASRVMGRQLIRSVTSTAANYRAACIARSSKEFYAKMSIVVEEADETLFWLEMIKDTGMATEEKLKPFIKEATEIAKVMSVARKNVDRS
ncbi:four helix bundle protein [uncultured Dokdonia sp.]|uniref:four helix bundle protein n=1 Tax=uncultured Dokdonia sp. TaxID=575653 RepID=UPI002626EA68|nr:four helix bundle protein [uncultured Dokdonia sp.]